MSKRIKWLVFAPVVAFVFGALFMSCSGGSSTQTFPPPEVLIALLLYNGTPSTQSPTPKPTTGQVNPTPTPLMTARPAAVTTSVTITSTVNFGDQGKFEVNGQSSLINFADLTSTSLFTTDNPTVLLAPPVNAPTPGTYTGVGIGCACVKASNSNLSTDAVSVAVVAPDSAPTTCGACPTFRPTPTATPTAGAAAISSAVENAAAVAPSEANNEGILAWTFDAKAKLSGQIVAGVDGTIYFITTDHVLHAVSNQGKELLRRVASGSSPIITSNGLIAYLNGSSLEALNPNGSLAWTAAVGSGAGPIATSGNTIYVATSSGLASVSTAGQVNWNVNAGSIDASAATAEGIVIAATHGGLSAFAVDGASSWTFSPSGGFSGGLAAQGDTIYAGSVSGGVYAIDDRTGKVNWQASLPAAISAGPAVGDNGTIYVTAGFVYAISSSGNILWQQTGSPTADGPIVAVGAQDVFDAAADELAIVLGADGGYVWSSRSFGAITTASSAAGIIYVGTADGKVFAVR